MAENLGTVYELESGVDYANSEAAARRAAHQWADRHNLKAVTSVPAEGGTIEIMFRELTGEEEAARTAEAAG